jgi:iron(III) transport system substrate-binding protein
MRGLSGAAGVAILSVLASTAHAVDYPGISGQASTLTIYSTTDTSVFEPVVREFQLRYPTVAVRYEELEGATLYLRHLRDVAARRPRADLLLSSSMDLQVKLVNDGYAAAHESANARALPAWARWRDQAFGFTFEPSVMVFNRRAIPRSRGELIALLRREPGLWRGRVGTYDIAQSSVGYLLASQDSRQSSEYGSLVETLGEASARIETRTGALLDLLASGELAIGYNLLGSYAEKRIASGAPLVIVYPRDYTLAVTRTAVIPAGTPNPVAAHAFLEYLLSVPGQEILASRGRLPAVRVEVAGRYSQLGIIDATLGPLRPIVLGPGLLVYLDRQKRSRFLANWFGLIGRPAVRQSADAGIAAPQ